MNQNLRIRLDAAYGQMQATDPKLKHDLSRMYTNALSIWASMSIELIVCRRVKKFTRRYSELETAFVAAVDIMEQYLTFATLLTK